MDLFNERIQLFKKATRMEKTDRVPTFSNYWTYMILDSGYKLTEGIYDLAKLEDAVIKFMKKYQFDAYNYTGTRNPFKVTEAFDGNLYILDKENDFLNYQDHYLMEEDEYDEYINDYMKFFWEKLVPRKCPGILADDQWERFDRCVEAQKEYLSFGNSILFKMRNELSVPKNNGMFGQVPFDMFFNYLRGIKNLSIDLRRRYDKVLEACKASEKLSGLTGLYAALEGEQEEIFMHNGGFCFLGHSILNEKQFGDIYWPYLKKAVDICAEKGKTIHLFSEASIGRYSCLADIPRGVLDLQPEQDDVFELRKKFPNICINGGMKSAVLGNATVEECLDEAKRLVEGMGPGFIMGQDKMMSYRNDAKPENIMAVQEFCWNYKY